MSKIHRIRVRGRQRKNPDAALLAEAIIQLGREQWAEYQKKQAKKDGQRGQQPSSTGETANPDGPTEGQPS
jgi:hypothetical protein